MTRWLLTLVCVMAVTEVVAHGQPAPTSPTPPAPPPAAAIAIPPPVTPTPPPSIAACNDGAGDAAVCFTAGDALATGAGNLPPDHRRALRFYRAACGLPADIPPTNASGNPPPRPTSGLGAASTPPPPKPGLNGDFRACKAASILHETGYLFEVDSDEHEAKGALDRAFLLASTKCTTTEFSGCAVASWAAQQRVALGVTLTDTTDPVKLAERGCVNGHLPEACIVLRDLAFRGSDADAVKIQIEASAGFTAGCVKDGNLDACGKTSTSAAVPAAEAASVRAAIDKLCTSGNQSACGLAAFRVFYDSFREPAKAKLAFDLLAASCAKTDPHPMCQSVASKLALGDARLGIPADPGTALGLAQRLCAGGDNSACRVAELLRGPKGPDALHDIDAARAFADRACSLSGTGVSCLECNDDPTLGSCKIRAAFRDRTDCLASKPGSCERVATRFQTGDGVPSDLLASATYLRHGCDGAEKSACVALDTLCTEQPDLPADVCAQALIHSDLFYEAEYQMNAGGDVDLVDPDAVAKPETNKTPGSVSLADAAAAAPTKYERGHLDASLVVDVVLDRARQAAIKLVVDELLTAERKARYRYLRDLLQQGAALLADPSTLRREKFQDLGMTVVRAFVASNLIDGLYPTGGDLLKANTIGATVKLGAAELHVEDKSPLDATMHGYLVDVAYYYLGKTRLFGRTSADDDDSLLCPWTAGPGATLCTQLAERATAERVIGVDKVLDGLRLAKALRDGGFEDLRRLIEAASRSNTIADLGSTPGLTLDAWQQQLVAASRTRLEVLREGLGALRALTKPATWSEAGPDLPFLRDRAAAAKKAIESPAVRLALGQENIDQVVRLIRLVERAERDMTSSSIVQGQIPPPPGSAATTPQSSDVPTIVMQMLRRDANAGLQVWGPQDLVDFQTRMNVMEKSLGDVLPALDRLESAIADIRAVFQRFPNPDGSVTLDVGNIPLYATGDLERVMMNAQRALADVDTGFHSIFPGEIQAQAQFARSATVRLIGFLDLMKRVARQSGLSQRCGDVIDALRLLGTYRTGAFDAPLYDVLEPVIDSIRTHEPMSLELLFAVIGHVRIDTLITKLQGKGNACKKETSVDCWTTKLIHALQESVVQDGGNIKIDGGKFAERLAQHGDDFRKRHLWRPYFHLTVGFGDLYSDPANDGDSTMRHVPLVSEQIGVGFASPSFSRDRFTFKVGAAASGLLYRAVLDSEESKAVMVHPIFFALDLGELVELYVSPAMLMVYPPEDGRGTTVRWGASAGLSVPLTAYLQRL